MTLLQPLRALRPANELASRLACPPYDVVSREEARAYAAGNEHCFFHISRPEIDLPASCDEHADQVYELGRHNLAKFRENGWLRLDSERAFYVYRQSLGDHTQVGVVGLASVADYDAGLIVKHELTRPDKEDDRTRHIDALDGDDESVFLTYQADPRMDAVVATVTGGAPEYDFTSEDQVRHTVWIARGAASTALQAALAQVPRLYIADGHHRCAAASRVAKLRRDRRAPAGGHEYFLATAFPSDQVQILGYHRAVRDLGTHSSAQFLQRLRRDFDVQPAQAKVPARAHEFGLYLDGAWHRLAARPGTFPGDVLGALDVSILQENIMRAILGIDDARTDSRIQFVGGGRGAQELERLVDAGRHRAAFTLFPTRLQELMAVADAGGIMPPKSTWFEPKLRSGLLAYLFS
jgi:uncharacterized protein (DUF1015 family)